MQRPTPEHPLDDPYIISARWSLDLVAAVNGPHIHGQTMRERASMTSTHVSELLT